MTSATTSASNQSKPSSSIGIPSQPAAARRTSPVPAVPAQLPKPKASYASATKPSKNLATIAQPSTITTGAQAPVQHGILDTKSSAGSMSAPTSAAAVNPHSGIAGGNINNSSDFTRSDSHGRKPSLAISASGTSGKIPNGGPVGQNTRPNIAFGSMVNNGQSSPAIVNSTPYGHQSPSLSAPRHDPRATSPAHSPAPIPQPPASGGKPPSGLQGQGNGLVFGSSGTENGDFRSPQGPLTPGSQPAHLRRESSQSGHSDISGAGMNRGGYMPPGGRGRGFAPYGNQSPGPNYRQMSNTRGPPNMSNQFQGQQMTNSPYRGRGSPAMMHVQPHMPPAMPPQMPYGGYPQGHLSPQQQYQMYGMQHYDPSGGYYQPYYGGHPGYPGAPPSPRNGQFASPYGGPPPPHQPSPYHPPSMSRSASQVSERPASSLGSRPPTTAGGASQANTPVPAPQSTPTSSNFQIPTRTKSKAIVIKNPQGEEVHFDKRSPAPLTVAVASSPVPPKSPAIVSSSPAPTPPPRTPSTASNSRIEPRSAKSDADIKNGFQEQVKRQIEAQKELERKQKEDSEPKAADDKAADDKPVEATTPEVKVVEEKPDAEEAPKETAVEAAPTPTAEVPAQTDNTEEPVEAAEEPAPAKESKEDEAARLKREEDERLEREIAEMEAAEEEREREEQERERKYQEKKSKEAAEKKKREAEAAANADAEMKRMEREAEELEAKRERERAEGQTTDDSDKAKADKELFASLKRPTLGPGATSEAQSNEPPVPAEEITTTPPPPAEPAAPARAGQRPKPASLKLRTDKPVEAAQPTPGMQALKSARLLDIQRDHISYPNGIQSPNPALNQAGKQRGRQYDKSFLLQFQEVFKEKPATDWDQKVKDTVGDGEPGSARTPSIRQSSVSSQGRQPSNRGGQSATPGGSFGPMGSFGGSRTLPPGTSSMDRFNASNTGARPPASMGGFGAGRTAGFPSATNMSRSGSLQPSVHSNAPPSPRPGASRGKGSRRGPDRAMSRKEEDAMAKTMPLTAGLEVKALVKSTTGWTPPSVSSSIATNAVGVDGSMPPDMVQRKVKAALNKMTPEKFDKISDQIMEIANQSKNETDGRTLRQVIQLTFEKACDEAHWAGMYAKFCQKMLTSMSNDIVDDTITKNGQPVTGGGLFRKYLLNRCQEEFERGWEANLPDKAEGETEEAALLSEEYYIAAGAKRRGLGLIQFIGELYKLGMLTYRIMHQCVMRLLNFEGQPDESSVENLCKLLRTVGATMDKSDEQGHGLVVAYFDRIQNILDQHKDMSSRSRFMFMDVLDLRKQGWKDKAAAKGPKTIQEIHAEAEAAQVAAEAERQRSNQRGGGRMPAGRGDARSFSSQGMPPPDYSRNEVRMDDLRRLQTRNAQTRTASSGLGPSLGPGSSLYAGRSGSGRKGLGPPRDGDASGNTSRTNTPPMKKEDKEPSAQANSFSALAALENEGAESSAMSPPSEKASPAVTKAVPSIDAASDAPNGA